MCPRGGFSIVVVVVVMVLICRVDRGFILLVIVIDSRTLRHILILILVLSFVLMIVLVLVLMLVRISVITTQKIEIELWSRS